MAPPFLIVGDCSQQDPVYRRYPVVLLELKAGDVGL